MDFTNRAKEQKADKQPNKQTSKQNITTQQYQTKNNKANKPHKSKQQTHKHTSKQQNKQTNKSNSNNIQKTANTNHKQHIINSNNQYNMRINKTKNQAC